jgi:hypothetical protein
MFRPLLLKIGPLPDVLGAGMFTPFSRMQLANFASACFAAALPNRPRPRASPPGLILKPHFFTIP